MSARAERVTDEPAFVLHRHEWSETSLVLDVFSRSHGRLALVAKGARRPSSQFRPVVLPLQPLRLGWGGSGEVKTLKTAEWAGGHLMPAAEALLAGCYLNELLTRLLPREDAVPRLFDAYADAVAGLAAAVHRQAPLLRAFELLLLYHGGYLPALNRDGVAGLALEPQGLYALDPEAGLRPVDEGTGVIGVFWLALQQVLDRAHPLAALVQVCQSEPSIHFQSQLRHCLHYHSGMAPFETRRLLLEVQRLQSLSVLP